MNRSLHLAFCRFFPALLFTGLASLGAVYAQAVNPLELDPRAAGAGGSIYRAQCATCHGADAKGIETIDAPDLTLLWTRGETTDETVFQTIRAGIPGSIMPPHGFPDAQVWMLVSYLRSVAGAGTANRLVGNESRGAELFLSNCARCHRVDGTGGSLGPDLSNITSRRPLDVMLASVRNPSASIARGYKPVTFLTAENEQVQGTIKSEDAFSIQIMDSNQALRGFAKNRLRELTRDGPSLMPAFPESLLSGSELNDLLSYLQSNRDR